MDSACDSTIGSLLEDQLIPLIVLEQVLEQYDEVTSELTLLCFQANKLWQLVFDYSLKRIVHKNPISTIPVVKEKLEYTRAMLSIYKSALISKTDRNHLIIFVRTILSDVLEALLQILGGNGYMQNNPSTELWLDCYRRIAYLNKVDSSYGNDI